MKRARLRLVKGGNSKQLWVHRATSMMPGAPKPKYVRKLIIDAWETGSLAGYHKHIIHRPLADHQMVAFKAIVVWMKLLQQGPPDILSGDAESAMTIIETMQKVWASTMSHALHVPALAILIHRFAVLLMVKFHFHSQHPEYDAHYVRRKNKSFDSISSSDKRTVTASSRGSNSNSSKSNVKTSTLFWEKNINVVSRLLTMIGTSDQLQRMVLELKKRLSTNEIHLTSTADSCLLPLVQEMISLVHGAARTMNSMRLHLDSMIDNDTTLNTTTNGDRVAVYNALVLQYTEQRNAVHDFFSKLHTVQSVYEFLDVTAFNSLPVVSRMSSLKPFLSSMNEFNSINRSSILSNSSVPPLKNINDSTVHIDNDNSNKVTTTTTTTKSTFLTTSSFNSLDQFRDSVFASFDQSSGVFTADHQSSDTNHLNKNNDGGWFDDDDEEDEELDDDINKFASFSGFPENHFESFGSAGSGGFGSLNSFGSDTSFGSRASFGTFSSDSHTAASATTTTTITNSAKKGMSKLLNIHDKKVKEEVEEDFFGFIDMNNSSSTNTNTNINTNINTTNSSNTITLDNDDNPFDTKLSFNDEQFHNNAFNHTNDTFENATFDSWSSDGVNGNGNGSGNVGTSGSIDDNHSNPFATGNLEKHIKHIDGITTSKNNIHPPGTNTLNKVKQVEEETKKSKDALQRLIENITLSGIEIDYNDINVGEQIGNGAFAIVNRKYMLVSFFVSIITKQFFSSSQKFRWRLSWYGCCH
jgi:hypothetical protein